MGDINIGKQEAVNIHNVVINNPEELSQIEASLRAIRNELSKIELPSGFNQEKLIKPLDDLLKAGTETQKNGKTVKEKLEKVNEYLSLIDKPLSTIKTLFPYLKKIIKIFGISGWLEL